LVLAGPSARFSHGGAGTLGCAVSQAGGQAGVHGFLPGHPRQATPPNPAYERASDASVAYAARDNVWLISYLLVPPIPLTGSPPFVDVFVSRSTDGGLHWGMPVVVSTQNHFLDKNWSVCDDAPSSPFFGRCYTEFDDATLGDLEEMSTSVDGGLTWGAPKTTASGSHGIGGQPLVRP